jgi:hypothetical protein
MVVHINCDAVKSSQMATEATALLSRPKSNDSIKSSDEIFAEMHGMENSKKVSLSPSPPNLKTLDPLRRQSAPLQALLSL